MRLRVPRLFGKQLSTNAKSSIFMPSVDYPGLWTTSTFPESFDDFARAVTLNSASVKFKHQSHPALESLQQVKEFKDFMITPTKAFLLNELQIFSDELVQDEYNGKSGNASRLLYGEKGIGKSSSLRFSAAAMAACHPQKLIPIYVELIGDSETFQTPSALISQALQLSPSVTISMCLEELIKRGQFVFFIADEIDQLYMSTEN